MLRIEKLTQVVGKHVYTHDGDYFGQIEEVNLEDNKIAGWKIKLANGFIGVLGGARGVVIPHQFVKAIGDVFIINRGTMPRRDEGMMDVGDSQGKDSLMAA